MYMYVYVCVIYIMYICYFKFYTPAVYQHRSLRFVSAAELDCVSGLVCEGRPRNRRLVS